MCDCSENNSDLLNTLRLLNKAILLVEIKSDSKFLFYSLITMPGLPMSTLWPSRVHESTWHFCSAGGPGCFGHRFGSQWSLSLPHPCQSTATSGPLYSYYSLVDGTRPTSVSGLDCSRISPGLLFCTPFWSPDFGRPGLRYIVRVVRPNWQIKSKTRYNYFEMKMD